MPKRKDNEFVHQVMRDFNSQKLRGQHVVVKLPCDCDVSVELHRPTEDQFMTCPVCKNKYFYSHSKRQAGQRIYTDDRPIGFTA